MFQKKGKLVGGVQFKTKVSELQFVQVGIGHEFRFL